MVPLWMQLFQRCEEVTLGPCQLVHAACAAMCIAQPAERDMAAHQRFKRRTEGRTNGEHLVGGRKCALGFAGEKLRIGKHIVPNDILRIVGI